MNIGTRCLSILLLGFFFVQSASAQTNIEVEFRVNMGVQLINGGLDPAAGDYVRVNGSFNGWGGSTDTLFADFLEPNVYTRVVQLDAYDIANPLEFKFTITKNGGTAEEVVGWEGGDNRKITVTGTEPDGDTNGYLDISFPAAGASEVFFSGITLDDIFVADTEVVVAVDARTAIYHIADSLGMPADVQTGDPVTSFDGLFANGPFASPNGWEDWGANLAAISSLQLVDDGTKGDAVAGDSVYTFTLSKKAGDAKRNVDLKFGVNGFDNESTFAGNHKMNVDEANPTVNLAFGVMQQLDGSFVEGLFDPYTIIDNSATPPSVSVVRRGGEADVIPVDVEIEFSVNMAVQLLNGNFDPMRGDYVRVNGSLNGWGESTDTLFADFLNPEIYTGIVKLDDYNVDSVVEFKFTLNTVASNGEVTTGWEGGDNKEISIRGDEPDSDGNGYIDIAFPVAGVAAPFYDGVSLDDIFSVDTEVTITVDARPAFYHLADSSGMPADVQTGDPVTTFDGLFANGPFASPNGWEDWGANLAAVSSLQLVDDGTNGDAVAGDTVYTIKIMKAAGQAKRGVDLKFGVNGLDNESAFAGNHRMNVDETNPVVNLTFGAMLQLDGTFNDTLYDSYILVDNTSTPPTATAVRRGGENDLVATDTETNTLPETVVLMQNFPNPFNPTTTIEYELTNSGRVTLQVFDLLGRQVATLIDGVMPAARHSVQFDARSLASGTYIYRLVANDKIVTKTMVLLK